MKDLFSVQDDVRRIVLGDGGNRKLRFEMEAMGDQVTVAVRASQGHIEASGVADDVLPVVEGLVTIAHGETLDASHSIVHEGISKSGRLHVHFYESDPEGMPIRSAPPVRMTSDVIIVVSAERCERFGLVFYRAANGAILTPCLKGYVPASCVLCVRQLPTNKVLWSSLS